MGYQRKIRSLGTQPNQPGLQQGIPQPRTPPDRHLELGAAGGHFLVSLAPFGEQQVGMALQSIAFRGQADIPARAIEQSGIQQAFQLLDTCADSGPGQIEPLSGPPESLQALNAASPLRK